MDEPHPPGQEHQEFRGATPARRRLGRGLSSLLGGGDGPALVDEGSLADSATGEFLMLDEHQLARNPWQPRKDFDDQALAELIDSVRQHGVLQPVLVRAVETGYQLIAGERRLIAARRAGLTKIPCRIVELDDRAVCEVAIVENVQRADLGDLEKAQAFQEYLDKFGGSVEELARKLGKDRSTISNTLRLLELPDQVKIALSHGQITAGHARALLPLELESDQIALCVRIQTEHWSVRQTEEAVRQQNQEGDESTLAFVAATGNSSAGRAPAGSHVQELERQLRDLLGAKVEIRLKGKDAGRLIVHFSSHAEFERITGFLRKAS
ncbi:MAG: ParB/RepB/Spo0J family partition protein [Planctomycetales bacterium]